MKEKFKIPLLQDMVWAISSSPLMEPDHTECCWYSAAWFQSLFKSSEPLISQQYEHNEAIQMLLREQKDQRLGQYFECLWLYWLTKSERYEVIEHNLAIRDGGVTLGELDFLVLDKVTRECIHWELAVKFFLGVGDTSRLDSWFGPGKKDRLDKKFQHLKHRQSVLTAQSAVKEILHEKGLKVDKCGVIFKGRLFYPHQAMKTVTPQGACQQHQRSVWYTLSDFERVIDDSDDVLPLLGFGWMALPEYTEDERILSKGELLYLIKSNGYRLPLCVAVGREGVWEQQIFVVADDWELTYTVEKSS